MTTLIGISQVTNLDQTTAIAQDLKIGSCFYVPSNLGGVYAAKCISVNEEKAILSADRDGVTFGYEINLQEPDMTDEEVLALVEALDTGFLELTTEQRTLMQRGNRLGLAVINSFTQYHATEKGVSRYRDIKSKQIS